MLCEYIASTMANLENLRGTFKGDFGYRPYDQDQSLRIAPLLRDLRMTRHLKREKFIVNSYVHYVAGTDDPFTYERVDDGCTIARMSVNRMRLSGIFY